MSKDKVVVLFSGGLESRYLLHLAAVSGLVPLCVLVDYNQVHKAELEKAEEVCTALKYQFVKVKVDLPVRAKLTGSDVTYPGVSEWYVPARNLIFAGLAASIAESFGIGRIWFGASYSDCLNEFPDCKQPWVQAVGQALKLGLSMDVKFEAPLMGMSKDVIKRLAASAGITEQEVYSGYGPADVH